MAVTKKPMNAEIDLDAGDDFHGDEMEGVISHNNNNHSNNSSRKKGRGFGGAREKREGFTTEGFDRVESSNIGKAQKSVEGWIVLVTNVHEELTEEDLMETFGDFGPVKNLHLNLDRRTGYVKGYALVEYPQLEQARAAIKSLDGQLLQGQKLSCDFAFVRGTSVPSSKQSFKSGEVVNPSASAPQTGGGERGDHRGDRGDHRGDRERGPSSARRGGRN